MRERLSVVAHIRPVRAAGPNVTRFCRAALEGRGRVASRRLADFPDRFAADNMHVVFDRPRLAGQEPPEFIAAVTQKDGALFFALYAFGDHRHLEVMRQRNDASRDGLRVMVGGEVGHKVSGIIGLSSKLSTHLLSRKQRSDQGAAARMVGEETGDRKVSSCPATA